MRAFLAATSYPRDSTDWRGRFIFDQVAALARQGVEVRLWAPPGELPPDVASALCHDDARWLAGLMEHGGIAHLLRRRPWAGIRTARQLLRRLRDACQRDMARFDHADLYVVNWLQNALALPDDGRPALVTVLGSDFGLLRLPGMATALRGRFRRRRTLLAPNAKWMVPRLRELFGDIAAVEAHPFGVDGAWFNVERSAERCGWLIVSRVTRAKLGRLLDWGEGMFSQQRPLHLLGPLQEHISLPSWIVHHGPTNPRELRERWFPCSIGLLTLSQHTEGRPQVLIEAMAASLPVVASDISAHADLVRHGLTGWLVSDRAELVEALTACGNPAAAARVGAAAREQVRREIGIWDDCARRYADACRRLLGEADAS